MKIIIEVDGHEAEELLALLQARNPAAKPSVALSDPDKSPSTQEPTEAPSTPDPGYDEGPEMERPRVNGRTSPSGTHTAVSSDRKPVEGVIGSADQKLKRTAQTSLADGTVIKEGTEVYDDNGELAVVEVTYRGNAVIRYDDDTGRFIRAADLQAGPPDEDVKEDEAGAPPSQPAQVSRDDVKRLAKELIPAVTSAVVGQIIFDTAGVRTFSAIEDKHLPAVYAALKSRAAEEADLDLDD